MTRSRRGFTLLEVLVATAILGLVMTTVYGVLARTLMATRRSEARAELYASGREQVMRIADEIEGALPPSTQTYFIGERRSDTPPADAVGFFTVVQRTQGARQQIGGLAFVSYSLDETDEPGLFALRRQEEMATAAPVAAGDDESLTDMESDGAESDPLVTAVYLIDRVAGLRLGYIEPETGDLVDEWDTVEPGPDNQFRGLPAAVSITLFLADEDGAIHDFSTTVDLPLARFPTPSR